MMPELDGFEVLRRMRKDGSTTPVIVLTGKVLTPTEQAALRDGFAHIIAKNGVSVDRVVEQVKRAVIQRRDEGAEALPCVLYVEDIAQNREIVRRYLTGVAHLLEAEDGRTGLEMTLAQKPDLVLMDLSLPGMDGWEVTRKIKESADAKDIPVVALTAHASPEDRQHVGGRLPRLPDQARRPRASSQNHTEIYQWSQPCPILAAKATRPACS